MSYEKTPYIGQPFAQSRKVFYTGSTALVRGQGLCFTRDYVDTTITGRASTDPFGGRDHIVELPDNSNNRWFAGVTADAYPAVSGGQWVDINEPGSVCQIAVDIATTIGSTRLTCSAGSGNAGRFDAAGFSGRGTAVALQTHTGVSSSTDTSAGIVASSTDGTATVDAAGTTITDTTAFGSVAAGDIVYIVGGKTTTNAGAAVTAGAYVVSSVTSSSIIVLTSACCSAASVIAYYIVRGNPTVLAYLQTGRESGLIEYVSSIATGAATTAFTAMVGGCTRFVGGETALGDGSGDDFTFTLADGDEGGLVKNFKLLDGIGTQGDVLITVTTGEQLDGSTDLASLELDGSLDESTLEWGGFKWRLMHNAGTGLA